MRLRTSWARWKDGMGNRRDGDDGEDETDEMKTKREEGRLRNEDE
jgi:hypothetical protein